MRLKKRSTRLSEKPGSRHGSAREKERVVVVFRSRNPSKVRPEVRGKWDGLVFSSFNTDFRDFSHEFCYVSF